jgi:hypothetical protein
MVEITKQKALLFAVFDKKWYGDQSKDMQHAVGT